MLSHFFLKLDNPLVVKLLQKLHLLSSAHKTIFFRWILSHISIRGDEAIDVATKESLNLNVTAIQVPYTDLKHHIKVEECNKSSCEALIFPYGVVLFNIFSTICI